MIQAKTFVSLEPRDDFAAHVELGEYFIALGEGMRDGKIRISTSSPLDPAAAVCAYRDGGLWSVGVDADFVEVSRSASKRSANVAVRRSRNTHAAK